MHSSIRPITQSVNSGAPGRNFRSEQVFSVFIYRVISCWDYRQCVKKGTTCFNEMLRNFSLSDILLESWFIYSLERHYEWCQINIDLKLVHPKTDSSIDLMKHNFVWRAILTETKHKPKKQLYYASTRKVDAAIPLRYLRYTPTVMGPKAHVIELSSLHNLRYCSNHLCIPHFVAYLTRWTLWTFRSVCSSMTSKIRNILSNEILN